MAAIKIVPYDDWVKLCNAFADVISLVNHVGCWNSGAHYDEDLNKGEHVNCWLCDEIENANNIYDLLEIEKYCTSK